ncbi:AMP-binding enzyme [Salinisphaera sp. RV14]|uniref:AMP-binding enzyme n=1 Tax=unclassified Salinisphaera TaxID=2649847 RepID=UPI003F84CBE2
MTRADLPRAAIRRLTAAVIAGELHRLRDEDIGQRAAEAYAPHETATPLALDSLERMGVAAALSEIFTLDDIAFAPETTATVAEWADGIAAQRIQRLTVHTSGSTGVPQRHSHATADLLEETREFARRFAGTRRVIALVPATHLYGLVWTALLPAVLDVPVIDGTVPGMPAPRAGDLVVGVPDHWAALARLRPQWPEHVTGISSGGPLANALGEAVLATGLARLVDVYGSSETSAIGLREIPGIEYTLLPRWRLAPHAPSTLIDRTGQPARLPDHVRPRGARQIELMGRRDHAVQVGGVNVYPDRIAAVLTACDGVAEAAVRLGDNGRLKAFIVPVGDKDEADLEHRLRPFVASQLPPAERPTRFRFGPALPHNPMGKPADWD